MSNTHRSPKGSAARFLAVATTLAMLIAALPLAVAAFAQDAPDNQSNDPGYTGTTIVATDGDSGVEAALAWSQLTNADDSAENVLLGREDLFADSLSSGGLQCRVDAPLLLTPQDSLDPDVAAELTRLGATTIHILGGEAAISEGVEQELTDAGYDIHRHAGITRVETAIDIAEKHFADATSAILARSTGEGSAAFADSLAAGGAACETDQPVLLTPTDFVTETLSDYLASSSITEITVAGGEGAVSADVVDTLEGMNITVNRLAGSNRAATAVAMAQAVFPNPDGVVLVDGYQDNSWTSGFAAAKYSAENNSPIVLAASGTQTAQNGMLPPETADYLGGLDSGTMLVCGPFVESEACAEAAELLGHTAEVTITVDTTAAAGGTVTGSVEGDYDTITVSGCGLTDQAVTPDADGNFTINLPSGQEAGECELTFTVTFDGTDETQTETFPITVTEPAGNRTVTDRPELVRAEITATNTTSGSTVIYTFDEVVTGKTADPTKFHMYRSNGTKVTATSAVVTSGNTTQVQATFPGVTTADDARTFTVATVDFDAVRDTTAATAGAGAANPIGDAPLAPSAPTLANRITVAPDLIGVSNFRASGAETLVDFKFDENVATVGTPTGFHLIVNPSGNDIPSTGVTNAAPASDTVTAIFPSPVTGTIQPSQVSRGTVDLGAVSDGTNTNVLQAFDVTGTGTTELPDLLSVEFRPDSKTGFDQVLFTFDDPVLATGAAALFNIYKSSGTPLQVDGVGTPVRSTTNDVSVLVDFPDGSLATAVGASVEDGAVTRQNAPRAGEANQQDEVGLATAPTAPPAGVTSSPDLISFVLEPITDPFGLVTGYTGIFGFDEDVDYVGPEAEFAVYGSGGGQSLPTGPCTNPTADDADHTIRCSYGTGAAGAVLGTVDDGAVVGEGAADGNPEGAHAA